MSTGLGYYTNGAMGNDWGGRVLAIILSPCRHGYSGLYDDAANGTRVVRRNSGKLEVHATLTRQLETGTIIYSQWERSSNALACDKEGSLPDRPFVVQRLASGPCSVKLFHESTHC